MTDSHLAEQKATLRERFKALRLLRSADADEAVRLSEQLGQFCLDHGVRRAAAYLPIAGEPDINPFLDWAQDNLEALLLPQVIATDLRWVQFSGATQEGELGFLEASGTPAALDKVDVVFLPALAADLSMNRLGKGKGFYDRALSTFSGSPKRPKLVAIVFDEEIVASLPAEQHDQKVDALITPKKTVWG